MIFNIFKKKLKLEFKFLSFISDFSIFTPVRAAKDFRPICSEVQKGMPARKRYQICPGLTDYASAGFIIPAHAEIKIKANGAGTFAQILWPEGLSVLERDVLSSKKFDFDIANGLAEINGVKKEAVKIPLPWMIQAPEGYSAYLLPALMHSDFLDKIHIYPGIVDVDEFHTINVVFSALKECEFTIPINTPILQVVFFKREDLNAVCRRATEYERHKYLHTRQSWASNWYRKFFHKKKVYNMECPYNNKDKK
jgi:dUTPase